MEMQKNTLPPDTDGANTLPQGKQENTAHGEYERRAQLLTELLLEKASLAEVVLTAARLMGCPIILTSNFYKVLCMEDLGREIDDPIWKTAAETGYCTAEAVALFEREGITREVLNSSSALILDRSVGKEIPRILQKIEVFGRTGAYIGVFQGKEPFTQDDLRTTDLLCRILSLQLEWSPHAREMGRQAEQSILTDLLDGSLSSATILGDRLLLAAWTPKPLFQCALLTPESSARQIDNIDYLCLALQQSFPDARVLQVNRGVLLLLNYDMNHVGEKDERILSHYADQYQLRVLLSSPFPHLIHLGAYYEACLQMDALPIPQRGEGRLLHFEDVLFPVLGEILTANERRAFTQSQYRRLLDWDRENGTEYCRTLRTYITCACSSTRTSETLFVHRNTLNKRLAKIREICGLDLEDGRELFHFYLSDQLHGTIL